MSQEADPAFERLLEFLRQSRGFDFTGYKRATLMRRIGKRIQALGLKEPADYVDYLQVHPDEYAVLFNTILINVTEFFRDKPSWDYIGKQIVPKLVERGSDEPIRVWSAGTASGEEAYSAAMLLCEALGQERFLEQVKVYATDVDEEALVAARAGYPAGAMSSVPEPMVKKYFDEQNGRYVFKPLLRRVIIFGRHDLLQDAPISRVDLLICRNTLMYFTAESQGRILARFHYGLRDDGFLFLGRAEMLLTHADLFSPVELKHRVFSKVPRIHLRDRLALIAQAGNNEIAQLISSQAQLRALAGEQLPVAEVVLDEEDTLVAANHLARASFRLNPGDIGRPFKDLELSFHPVGLRSPVSRAARERTGVVISDVQHHTPDGTALIYDVHIMPLLDDRKSVVGTSITFRDVTEVRRLQSELERVRQEVETANEELQSSYEELETTNEELQSTIEELETTNEELQSSNEELETMNEELESTNTELQTINSDLRERTDEVDRLNAFLDAILSGLHVGIAVLDTDLAVLMWNARSQDLWGLREDEAVGKPFLELDIGLPLDLVEPVIKGVVGGTEKHGLTTLQAVNRRGRTIMCRVSVTPLSAVAVNGEGVVVVMEEMTARAHGDS